MQFLIVKKVGLMQSRIQGSFARNYVNALNFIMEHLIAHR